MLSRMLTLGAFAVLAAASHATIVTLSFGNFSTTGGNPGLGKGLFVTQNGSQTFAGEILASGDALQRKFYCLTPDRTLYLPSTQKFKKSLVKSYNGIWAGTMMADMMGATNQAQAGRQLGLWLAAGKTVTNYGTWNGTTAAQLSGAINPAAAYVASTAYTTQSTVTAKEFWLYEPVDKDGKVIQSVQSLASEAVPEPATLALGLAGLAGAVRRRRNRR